MNDRTNQIANDTVRENRDLTIASVWKAVACIVALIFSTSCRAQEPGGIGLKDRLPVWLDASSISGVGNGSKLLIWPNLTGASFDAVQPDLQHAPTFSTNQLNGHSAVTFDRTTAIQSLTITEATIGKIISNSMTIFVVSKGTNGGTSSNDPYQALVSTGGSTLLNGIFYWGYPTMSRTSFRQLVGGDGTAFTAHLTPGVVTQRRTWNIAASVCYEGPTITRYRPFMQGAQEAQKDSELPMTDFENINNTISIGATTSLVAGLNGVIAEILVYDVALSNEARIIVNNYLSAKYDQIDEYDFYSGHAPEYTLEVMGIGTWSGQQASTVHKASNNNGLHLEQMNNTLNGSEEFVMAGRAPGDNSEITTELVPGVAKRWSRDWFVQKTGTIDASLAFDVSEAGLQVNASVLNASNFLLLYRSSTNGGFTVVGGQENHLRPTLLEGDRISFSVPDDLLMTGYYTLGYGPTISWTGAADQDWQNPANWDLNRSPGPNDGVIVNACMVCPQLTGSATVKSLYLASGSEIDIKSHHLNVADATSAEGVVIRANGGALQSADINELKNCNVVGTIAIRKTGGEDNKWFGGNTFDSHVSFFNDSNSTLIMSAFVDNEVRRAVP